MHPTACPCSVACWRTSTASIRPCAWNTPNCPPRRCTTRSSRGVATRQAKNPARTWSSAAPWTCRPSWPTTATRCPMTRPRPAPPAWANWRDEVFSTGTDPIVMVYDTRRLDATRAPRTRRALLSLLQAPDRPLAGAPSTYDVGASAIGYLAATQDTRLDSMAPALLAALGQNDAALYARRTTRWTCWNAATPRWPTTCWSLYPPPHRTRRPAGRHLPARLHADAVTCRADPARRRARTWARCSSTTCCRRAAST